MGAVHGQRGPVLGHFRRRASAQQSLGAGAAEIQGRRPTAAVALMTEWSEITDVDWEAIARGMRPPRFVFDSRNALDAARMEALGFEYTGVGRNFP